MAKTFGIIAIVVLAVISFGSFFGLARATINEIAGFDFQTVNEKNYLKVEDYTITSTENENVDIKVTVDDDGIITLKGENKMQGVATHEVAIVVLQAGDYEFVSNAKGCSKDTYQLILKDNNEGIIIADEIFTVTEATEYTVYISINGGVEINTKFAPVIVNVGESTKFIVNNWNIFKK